MADKTEGTPVAKVGRVTKENPLLKFSKAGKPYTKFGLAVTPYAPKDQPKPETTFYDVTTFGSLAESVAQNVARGDVVLVFGKGQTETWTGQDGQERTTKVILADDVGLSLRSATPAEAEPGTEVF